MDQQHLDHSVHHSVQQGAGCELAAWLGHAI
jgi:hypothetical protein